MCKSKAVFISEIVVLQKLFSLFIVHFLLIFFLQHEIGNTKEFFLLTSTRIVHPAATQSIMRTASLSLLFELTT